MKTTIDDQAEIATLLNTFHVAPERQAEVVDELIRFTRAFARHRPGFVAAAIHKSLDGRRVINYVQWESRAHLEAMLAESDAKSHMAAVGTLAERVDPVACAVAYVGAKGDSGL